MTQITAWFASVDTDRSKTISVTELAQYPFNNKPLGFDLARQLLKVFDKDNSGSLQFYEFASLYHVLTLLLQTFNTIPKSGNSVPTQNVLAPLQGLGFPITQDGLTAFAGRYEPPLQGQLSWDAFLALGVYLSRVRSLFEWSDTDKDGKITLTFEQLAQLTLWF